MSYFDDGYLVAESGEVRVYDYGGHLHLEIGQGHSLWAVDSEIDEYSGQIGDLPGNKCLEIGLGLGTASNYILSKENVKHLITVEKNRDVIKIYEQMYPEGNEKHTIICQSGLDYLLKTKYKYDFLFLDAYSLIDEDTLPMIKNLIVASKKVLNKDGILIAWCDIYTPEEFEKPFFNLLNI